MRRWAGRRARGRVIESTAGIGRENALTLRIIVDGVGVCRMQPIQPRSGERDPAVCWRSRCLIKQMLEHEQEHEQEHEED